MTHAGVQRAFSPLFKIAERRLPHMDGVEDLKAIQDALDQIRKISQRVEEQAGDVCSITLEIGEVVTGIESGKCDLSGLSALRYLRQELCDLEDLVSHLLAVRV